MAGDPTSFANVGLSNGGPWSRQGDVTWLHTGGRRYIEISRFAAAGALSLKQGFVPSALANCAMTVKLQNVGWPSSQLAFGFVDSSTFNGITVNPNAAPANGVTLSGFGGPTQSRVAPIYLGIVHSGGRFYSLYRPDGGTWALLEPQAGVPDSAMTAQVVLAIQATGSAPSNDWDDFNISTIPLAAVP